MADAEPQSERQNLLDIDSNSKAIVIPASITVLTKESFQNASGVESITFEVRSRLRRLETGTFSLCSSLKSICIAASVEFIGRGCFARTPDSPASISIEFDKASQLREIEPGAFDGCSLSAICIPASVETMTGASLPRGPHDIMLSPGNEHFGQRRGFLMDLKHHCALRYLGSESKVRIPDQTEKIDENCFACLEVRYVEFGSILNLSSMESEAFCECGLMAITIPSSVTFLGRRCFYRCWSLRRVAFRSGSKLKCISDEVFRYCRSLASIILPSTVRTIGDGCFSYCWDIVTPPLQGDSEVSRIGGRAFESCSALKSLFLPGSVEFIGENCFEGCEWLSNLAFASPSLLRELRDLPSALSGFVSVPDSVEFLGSFGSLKPGCDQVLSFGVDSRLSEIRSRSARSFPSRSFLRLATRCLKNVRMNVEFATET
jgi:hypothetical protein